MTNYEKNLEIIKNSEKFIELHGVLPIVAVEELLRNMILIQTNNFSKMESFEGEIEKIAQLFK